MHVFHSVESCVNKFGCVHFLKEVGKGIETCNFLCPEISFEIEKRDWYIKILVIDLVCWKWCVVIYV